jgi:serine/threonine-protein kinase
MSRSYRRGSRLGKYRLERRIGEGGSATVWKARDTIEGRWVALKIVSPAVVTEFGREAIETEARIAAQLDHPRIATIRNADWIDGTFVLVTDLARASLDRTPAIRRSPARILSVIADAAEGLAHAHERGLIHRDVKPANILIYADRHARLADFGTARIGQARTRVLTEAGTMGYMAPEQAYGRPRFASDVFSLALTAYELWAGVLPGWPFEWPLEGAERFERRCPRPVQPVIRRALSLDLKQRYADGIEFHRALARAIDEHRGTQRGRPTRGHGGSRQRLATGGHGAKAHSGVTRGRRGTRRRRAPEADPFSLEAGWFRKRYGKALETRYDCHACDGPISESMRHCPWCGTTQNSFAEVTSFPLVCPDCERGVRSEWGACPTCRTGRFEPNGRPIPGEATAERHCTRPGCGAPIQRFMHYCPACKARVERPWKVEGLPPCERCRWPFVSRWRFCAWCGRRNPRALVVGRRG